MRNMNNTTNSMLAILAATVGVVMALAPMAQGAIIEQWTFNDDNADGSFAGINGAIVGGPSFVNTPADPGMANRGISMDGEDDLVNFGNSALLNLPDKFTIEAWVTIPSVGQSGNFHGIFGKGGSYMLAHEYNNGNSERWRTEITTTGGTSVAEGPARTDPDSVHPYGDYDHILVTKAWSPTGTDPVQFYVNKKCHNCDAGGRQPLVQNANDVFAGFGFGNHVKIIIDEITIHDNRMNPGQVSDRFNLGPQQFIPEPGTLALLGMGLLAMIGIQRRRS